MGQEKQEACQLYIEQEIEKGLSEGKTAYSLGKEIAVWIEKLFEVKMKPRTIEKRADRIKEDLATNVAIGKGLSNSTKGGHLSTLIELTYRQH